MLQYLDGCEQDCLKRIARFHKRTVCARLGPILWTGLKGMIRLLLTVAAWGGYTVAMPLPNRSARRFAPRRTGDASPLGRLETAVMDAVWSLGTSVNVAEVLATLPGETAVAYNTVKTTMERLADKGILSRTKAGKAYFYEAAVSREDLERRIVAGALDRLVEQFPNAIASFFARPDPALSEEKLSLLLEAIERRREAPDA